MCGGDPGGGSGGPSAGRSGPGPTAGRRAGGPLSGSSGAGDRGGSPGSGLSVFGGDRDRSNSLFVDDGLRQRQNFGTGFDPGPPRVQQSPQVFVLPDVLPSFAAQGAALPASFGTSPAFTQGAQGSALQPIGLPLDIQAPVVSSAPFTQQGSDQSGRVILNALGTLAQQSGVNLGF